MRTSQPITMYTTQTCGHCVRLKRALAHEGVKVVEIDVDRHAEYGRRIEAATGGFRIVPTVEVEGRLLVNPRPAQVLAVLPGN
jgi:mycoredoxin